MSESGGHHPPVDGSARHRTPVTTLKSSDGHGPPKPKDIQASYPVSTPTGSKSIENGGHQSAPSGSSGGAQMQQKVVVVEEAMQVEDAGAKPRSLRSNKVDQHTNDPHRLILVSSKIKNIVGMQTAILPNVILVQYKYESATLDGIQALVNQQLAGRRVASIAMVMHGSPGIIYISAKDDKVITRETLGTDSSIQDFLISLVGNHLDGSSTSAQLDFLACHAAQGPDASAISHELANIVKIKVTISKDIAGADLDSATEDIGNVTSGKTACVGDMYFKLDRLRNWSGHNQQTLAGFEKIRTVGKGAYGNAILYRKKDDDSLVILKEINLHDLSAAERQMSLNEVKVLAMLDHPNIISYYDSFEEDGIIMIEMEYADGGTLAQYLNAQEKPLEEKDILGMFQQMVAGIKHIHEHNILHRDLKTANIFLTKEGAVKIGDFGICKLMSTSNQGANTVLGTPYYISPEMCEGKPYNDRSDIWALGCILYEMACLQKTFEGSNLPALVNKIMKGQFAPVKGNFSSEFKLLIRDILQREPEYRPSAAEIWNSRLPILLAHYDNSVSDDEDINSAADSNNGKSRKTRSVLYYFEMCSMSLYPIELPSKIKIRDVAVGDDHVIVVTMEQMVYSWGEGNKGQLGHGVLESCSKPTLIEALKEKSIVKICCGDGFSVFGSDNGIVMTCGDGTYGCLGHGDWCSTSRPRLIEALLSVDVTAIKAGPRHVVAVGSEGEVFAWGCGADGKLGLGDDEDQCLPTEVHFSEPVFIRDVCCGSDGTMLLTDVGSVLACGNNQHNKLGLNLRQGFLMAMKNIFNKTEVEGQKVFTLVKALARHRVVHIYMGLNCSAIVVESGHVFMFGANSEGQLGTGNTKPQNAPIGIKIFEEKPALKVQCGEFYSVGATTDNDLYFWGARFKKPPKLDESLKSTASSKSLSDMRVESATGSSPSNSSLNLKETGQETPPAESAVGNQLMVEHNEGHGDMTVERQPSSESVFGTSSQIGPGPIHGGFRPLSSSARRRHPGVVTGKDSAGLPLRDDVELILNPTALLRMDSSGTHSPGGETVTLSNFFCHGENLFIEVETTAPPPKRRSRRKRNFRKRVSEHTQSLGVRGTEASMRTSASSHDGGDEYSSETSEYDTYGQIPAWIKHELANSGREANPSGGAGGLSDNSEDDSPAMRNDSSMSSIRINKHLKHEPHPPSAATPHRHADRRSADGSTNAKLSSQESGVDFTPVEVLSSSSSSEALAAAQLSEGTLDGSSSKSSSTSKKSPAPRKVSAPTPYRSKLGPAQCQKPLNRIRAQNKSRTRSSDPVKDVGGRAPNTDPHGRSATLLLELERMKEEKRKTEKKLLQIEAEHRKQQELLQRKVEKEAGEREIALKGEIVNLRDEMQQQNNKLQDHYNVVLSLQEQLGKVQSEQQKFRDQPPTPRQSARESKICAIQ